MNNPFEEIDSRLSTIESLLLGLQNQSKEVPKDQQVSERLLNVKEAAEFLNLKIPTIYAKVSRGELPVMKRSKQLYFSSIELAEYLKAGRKKTHLEIAQSASSLIKSRRK